MKRCLGRNLWPEQGQGNHSRLFCWRVLTLSDLAVHACLETGSPYAGSGCSWAPSAGFRDRLLILFISLDDEQPPGLLCLHFTSCTGRFPLHAISGCGWTSLESSGYSFSPVWRCAFLEIMQVEVKWRWVVKGGGLTYQMVAERIRLYSTTVTN